MLTKQQYTRIVQKNSPKSNTAVNCVRAFFVGGGICTLGQAVLEIIKSLGVSQDDAKTLTSISLVFLGVLLTALGVYDKIAKFAGAGTLVPITGFANAVSSPAIEFKSEGYVTGLGAKMFIIAGPVIVFGTAAATLYGVILWVLHLFGITLF